MIDPQALGAIVTTTPTTSSNNHTMKNIEERQGEVALSSDPAEFADDGRVVFIGKMQTPWKERSQCPRNLAQARSTGKSAQIRLDSFWRQGLNGLDAFSHVIVLYWMHEARRDLIIQSPRHKNKPTGVFALRSPVRPNPIALAIVKILKVDIETGTVEIDAIDCLDGTPVIDIKPWFETIDQIAT